MTQGVIVPSIYWRGDALYVNRKIHQNSCAWLGNTDQHSVRLPYLLKNRLVLGPYRPEKESCVLNENCKLRYQINLDRHSRRPSSTICHLPDPPLFSLFSTFKALVSRKGYCLGKPVILQMNQSLLFWMYVDSFKTSRYLIVLTVNYEHLLSSMTFLTNCNPSSKPLQGPQKQRQLFDPETALGKKCETLPMTGAIRKPSLVFLVSNKIWALGSGYCRKSTNYIEANSGELLQSAFWGFRGKFIEANKKLTLLSFLHCPRISCLNCLHRSLVYHLWHLRSP